MSLLFSRHSPFSQKNKDNFINGHQRKIKRYFWDCPCLFRNEDHFELRLHSSYSSYSSNSSFSSNSSHSSYSSLKYHFLATTTARYEPINAAAGCWGTRSTPSSRTTTRTTGTTEPTGTSRTTKPSRTTGASRSPRTSGTSRYFNTLLVSTFYCLF